VQWLMDIAFQQPLPNTCKAKHDFVLKSRVSVNNQMYGFLKSAFNMICLLLGIENGNPTW